MPLGVAQPKGDRVTTVGIEEEFHLVDRRSRSLISVADTVMKRLPGPGFTGEAKLTCVETNTMPHANLGDLRDDLVRLRTRLVAAAGSCGVDVLASGTAPLTALADAIPTPEVRYAGQEHTYARLAAEALFSGLHVHVAAEDRDVAAASLAWISPWVPVLSALCASSPYWLGEDTGYASWRTMLWQRWPTAGPAPRCRSAAEYDALVAGLLRSGVIQDKRMVYHDLRLSAHLPTIELRVCDAVPDLDRAVVVAAVFRALVRRAGAAVRAGRVAPHVGETLLRAATWRAARSGLEGDLVNPRTGVPEAANAVIRELLGTVEPELRWYGDWERVSEGMDALVRHGSWARRQRMLGRREGLSAVVDLLARETAALCSRPTGRPGGRRPRAFLRGHVDAA
ncbi:MAG: glutamate--cysteine ligase [Streptomycetaceae bacterium]|nr:glutamate--cysteine ligase [Streptomycetaceae bacterium]